MLRVGAGVLLTDRAGRILLVEPTYKKDWEIPGGLVEGGESPSEAAAREVREELGLDLAVGELLVVHYTDGGARWPTDGLMFVFDGGGLVDEPRFVLPADELRSWEFVAADLLHDYVSDRLARRLRLALTARRERKLMYLER